MFKKLRALLLPAQDQPAAPLARVPAGQRVYAIGDIHGRLDLFEQLLELIEADDAARGPADTRLVLLGDLIDRGPDSCGVMERAMALVQGGKVRVLAGNHEEMLLNSLEDAETLRHFLRHGGKETLFSYGLQRADYAQAKLEWVHEQINALLPPAHIAFIQSMENQIIYGDYLFVHAGIRPGVPLDQQAVPDLRWIRREFRWDSTIRSSFRRRGARRCSTRSWQSPPSASESSRLPKSTASTSCRRRSRR